MIMTMQSFSETLNTWTHMSGTVRTISNSRIPYILNWVDKRCPLKQKILTHLATVKSKELNTCGYLLHI